MNRSKMSSNVSRYVLVCMRDTDVCMMCEPDLTSPGPTGIRDCC